jgi:hypothetical protein
MWNSNGNFYSVSKHDSPTCADPNLYWSIVGSLYYLSFTRSDIAFIVHRVSKFMHNPKDSHWQAVKHILCYLKNTVSYGLFLTHSSSLSFQAFADNDWAEDPDDRRSVGSYCVYLGSRLISWSCKQRSTVARSSTEVEYKALANAAAE